MRRDVIYFSTVKRNGTENLINVFFLFLTQRNFPPFKKKKKMFHVIIIFCCSQSYTGNILVSVNPYKMFDIYGLDMVKKYENQILGTLPPWVVIFEFSWVVVYCSLDFVVALVIWLWYCIFSFYPLLFCLAPSQWKPHSRSAAEIWRAGLENRCCATMWSVYSILFSKTTWQQIFYFILFFSLSHFPSTLLRVG